MHLKQRVKNKETLYWTNLTVPIPDLPYLVKRAGFDFVVIDALNGEFASISSASEIIRICRSIELPCIYRSDSDVDLIRALDQGVSGVACMNVKSRSGMKEFIETTSFFPKGNRRPNPFTPQGNFAIDSFSDIKKVANDETVIWLFIEESINSIQTMKDILSIPGIDIAYLGHLVSNKLPQTVEMAKAFRDLCKQYNIGVAGFHYDIDNENYDRADAIKFTTQEPSIIGVSTDRNLIFQGLKRGLNNLQKFHQDNSKKVI